MTHFINKSGETIPPFGCMQICIPPTKWDAIKKLPLTDGAKEILINGGLIRADELPRYDQDTVLYCIKPNFASALYQDSSTIAFNGPSHVEPDKQGVCTVGKYPAKAIASQFQYPYLAMAVMANSWVLQHSAIEFSAFRMLYPTTHEVIKATRNAENDFERFVTFVEPNTRRKEFYPLRTEGIVTMSRGENDLLAFGRYADWAYDFVTADQEYFDMIGSNQPFGNPLPFVDRDALWFNQGRLEMPGRYLVRIVGKLEVMADPKSLEFVPVSLKLKFNPDSTSPLFFETELDVNRDLTFIISRYTVPPGPDTFAWPTVTFQYEQVVRFRGQRGKLVFENNSSPFVQPISGVGTNSGFFRMDITRLDFNTARAKQELDWAQREFFESTIPANPASGRLFQPNPWTILRFDRRDSTSPF